MAVLDFVLECFSLMKSGSFKKKKGHFQDFMEMVCMTPACLIFYVQRCVFPAAWINDSIR